jgi:glucosyl-3-phosphoglycerate synthase
LDVNAWFSKRTLNHKDFAAVADLVQLKQESGLTISVCLPTKNSAEHLDQIIRTLKQNLIIENQLIDELIIIDGASTDGTAEIARDNGIAVYQDSDGFSDLPPSSGKGEGLWKSVFHTEGDIIAWLDSDIANIHPRFVYGTVGALLKDPSIGYVKAYYERPLADSDGIKPSGGGRVTELVARPLINLYYPELAGIIQPLSGEYAGRREVLESVPFVSGYGVETGLIIDIMRDFGVDAIAQVDMDTRIHQNQNLDALGRMAFGVMQTFFNRLDRDEKIKVLEDYANKMHRIIHTDGSYRIEAVNASVVERPAMNSRPEYKDKFAGRKAKWPSE